ncbi:hypothetical protein WA158_003801 [Blastocystis sp. Blastoise]
MTTINKFELPISKKLAPRSSSVNVMHPFGDESYGGILIRDNDYSNIELGDFSTEYLVPLGEEKSFKYNRRRSQRLLKFNDEIGESLETVIYDDNLVYPSVHNQSQGCCTIF